jgi:hypothetical protein
LMDEMCVVSMDYITLPISYRRTYIHTYIHTYIQTSKQT